MERVYVTYNPGEPIEENTVLRLQTISNLYGITVELPFRINAPFGKIHTETIKRIQRASFVICISLRPPSEILKSELIVALENKIPIVIIHDSISGNPFGALNDPNIFQVGLDFRQNNQDTILHNVARFLKDHLDKKKAESGTKTGLAILGVTLGLLFLNAIASNEDDEED